MTHVVLVCGSRLWTDEAAIREALEALPNTFRKLVHGDCRGADKLAGKIGAELGMEVVPYPADWARWARAAGPRRNAEMLKANPDLVLAFTRDLETSFGTRDMVRRAQAHGVPVKIYGRVSKNPRPFKHIKRMDI